MATIRINSCLGACLGLFVVAMIDTALTAELMDIKNDIHRILRHHNHDRGRTRPPASNMLEMVWDDRLEEQARRWAGRCQYARPSSEFGEIGYNLYYHKDIAYSLARVKEIVNYGLESWSRGKSYYEYSNQCNRACSYAQMISANTRKIGCAVSNCDRLRIDRTREHSAALFVCFYDRRLPVNSYPYIEGSHCSRCPQGALCKSNLCSDTQQDSYVPYRPYEPYIPLPEAPVPITEAYLGPLRQDEKDSVLQAHNRMRDSVGLPDMTWDPNLERWAKWVIRCETDYPGPRTVYTNFHRLNQGESLYDVPLQWSGEGYNTNQRFTHGCRTPNDETECNHYTNLLQDSNYAMACETMECPRRTRHLVCLYSSGNYSDRRRSQPYRRRQPRRRPSRREETQLYRGREPARSDRWRYYADETKNPKEEKEDITKEVEGKNTVIEDIQLLKF